MKPTTHDAYQLFHEGVLALAEVEANGMRIDRDLLEKTIKRVNDEVATLTEELKASDVWKVWKRRFQYDAKMGSRAQMAVVLFEEMGFQGVENKAEFGKKKAKYKMDETALSKVDHPFVKSFLRIDKLKHLKRTYLEGLMRELVGEYVHGVYNLHIARTFRSSEDTPNLQNQIVRNPEFAELLRRCFIPRRGSYIIEVDYSALEFKIAACFWRDNSMVAYASDPDLDIHRDMAAECYMLPVDKVSKQCRFYAKNQFVFPQLYGSDYINCSRNLWNVIGSAGLKTAEGIDLGTHLQSKGVRVLGRLDRKQSPLSGSFERHIQKVERRFNDRFPQWSERKEKWWKRYQEHGCFRTMTGFTCTGVYSRNDLMNYPIQGPAFHCLLWCLIQMVKWIRKNKMRSRIIGQIHDSMIADVPRDELQDYIAQVILVMTEMIRRHWDWIIVPLKVEVEGSETNWFEKKAIET